MPTIADAFRTFADDCRETYSDLKGGQAEDQLKSLVGALLQEVGPIVNLSEVGWRTEVREDDVDGRPDLGVLVDKLLVGHIELKAPDVGALDEKFKGANKKQFERFKALPNLIYTDGATWTLYRSGERTLRVRVTDDIRSGSKKIDRDALPKLRKLLADFLHWQPVTPKSVDGLAKFIAPLARILRDEVEQAIQGEQPDIAQLAGEWRGLLFPEAGDTEFADAYAQTVTYALLLAKFEGADSLNPFSAVPRLQDTDHALLAAALQLLEAESVRKHLLMPIELLERAIGAIDDSLAITGTDWLYFYEDFLAAYDPELKKNYGVYYTPQEVVRCQVRLTAELLDTRFDKELAFADDGVQILDPAVGTGTYPLAIIEHAADAVASKYGAGVVPARINSLADRLEAFELLVGPYAVARLRITQALHSAGAKRTSAKVYLADTLSSPNVVAEFPAGILQQPITRDREAAKSVKNERNITVCIGNPPYDRVKRENGGWVTNGDGNPDETILIDKFADPVKEADGGIHLKNLYNLYVFFWRWALWKVFESPDYQGIVTFITASSFLTGPAFAGMREVMRETFDELWVIDLEGGNLGARRTENVFAIRTPVAIAIGVRTGVTPTAESATVHIAKLAGSTDEKLAALDEVRSFTDLEWQPSSPRDERFHPHSATGYSEWPKLTDIFPWQQSGVKFGRTWPIAPDRTVLTARWSKLLAAPPAEKRRLFHETRDRKVGKQHVSLFDDAHKECAIADETVSKSDTDHAPYAYRAHDRQWVIADNRLADVISRPLWRAHSSRQVYLTSLLTNVPGKGPAAVATSLIPDLDHFRGSFGAKHVMPLYRDAAATTPNVTKGLLAKLGATAEDAEDLFAYAYGILASPAYVERFWNELELPPPSLPITKDRALFAEVAAYGRNLIYLHTRGERFGADGERGSVPQGAARCTKPVPDDSDGEYPGEFSYDQQTHTLRVGDGEFTHVAPEVFGYAVSGLKVVQSWLGYRMREPKGKKSSPLNKILPDRWTFSEDLLYLLWVLERTISLEPEGKALFDRVCDSELWLADDLPTPISAERKPPAPDAAGDGGQMNLDD